MPFRLGDGGLHKQAKGLRVLANDRLRYSTTPLGHHREPQRRLTGEDMEALLGQPEGRNLRLLQLQGHLFRQAPRASRAEKGVTPIFFFIDYFPAM